MSEVRGQVPTNKVSEPKAITPKLVGLQKCSLKPMDGSLNASFGVPLLVKWKVKYKNQLLTLRP